MNRAFSYKLFWIAAIAGIIFGLLIQIRANRERVSLQSEVELVKKERDTARFRVEQATKERDSLLSQGDLAMNDQDAAVVRENLDRPMRRGEVHEVLEMLDDGDTRSTFAFAAGNVELDGTGGVVTSCEGEINCDTIDAAALLSTARFSCTTSSCEIRADWFKVDEEVRFISMRQGVTVALADSLDLWCRGVPIRGTTVQIRMSDADWKVLKSGEVVLVAVTLSFSFAFPPETCEGAELVLDGRFL